MEINKKAWAILSENERASLGLQFGQNKSSWEAGQILGKSHYKYLEIKYRATHMIKMFTQHFELYDEVIPKYVPGEAVVKRFLVLCIEKRNKPKEAMALINDNDLDRVYTKTSMNERIIAQVNKWGRSEDPHQIHIFNLVKEFDRWNNYRILPKEIQEPSAYKRRVKNMYKKHIRVLKTIPALSYDKLLKLTKPKKIDKILYLPLFDKMGKIIILKVRAPETMVKIYNSLCLYTFETEKLARDYITPVYQYLNLGKKECQDGIDFWQHYRDSIRTSTNYSDIQNITATRAYLEMAYSKLQFL